MDGELFKKIDEMPSEEKKELISHLQNSLKFEKYPSRLIDERYEQLLSIAESVFDHKMEPDKRHVDDVMIRRFIAYKLREDGYTYTSISRVMKKDHATIIHLVRQMDDFFSLPAAYKGEIKKYLKFHSMILQDGNENGREQ